MLKINKNRSSKTNKSQSKSLQSSSHRNHSLSQRKRKKNTTLTTPQRRIATLAGSDQTTTTPNDKLKKKKLSSVFKSTKALHDMTNNPYNYDDEVIQYGQNDYTYVARVAADRPLRVILAGFNSFFAQQLLYPLKVNGMDVIPVTQVPTARHERYQSLSYDQINEHGLPDADIIINCSGTNIYDPIGDPNDSRYNNIPPSTQSRDTYEQRKILNEDTRLKSNQFWSEKIRQSRTKPFVYVNISSALYYPSNPDIEYDEQWQLPPPPDVITAAMSNSLENPNGTEHLKKYNINHTSLQAQELSIPYWSRFFRDTVEYPGRISRPELDYRTAEQILEYQQYKAKYDNRGLKHGVYTPMGDLSPQQQLDNSPRKDLLTNTGVRYINFRLGHVLGKTMQEHALMQPWLDRGLLAPIGDGTTLHPWIHGDDACRLLLHSIFTESINGPVNAVAPTYATNDELLEYITRARSSWKNSFFKISPKRIDEEIGPILGHIFHSTRKVKPSVALDTKFKWDYPTIQSAIEDGLTNATDREANKHNGWYNSPRNTGTLVLEGFYQGEGHLKH